MTARRLTHLTARLLLTLPLAACAAQPGPGQATGRPDAPAADARSAAAAPSTAPAPAAAPAAPVAQDTQAGTDARQAGGSSGNGAAPPRHTASGHAGRTAGNATTTAGAEAGARAAAPSAGMPSTGVTSATGTSATGMSATGISSNNTSTTDAPAGATSTTGAATGPAPAAATAPDVVAPRPATPGTATPGATVPPVAMPAGSPTGGLLQTLFALILVLAVLGALAWFLKRYGPRAGGGNANLRVVGSLNLGGRERIMVVEVGNQWIVVGASPGRINALATLPRQDGQNGDTDASDAVNAALARQGNAAPGAHSFADWLKQTIDKRK